jgi:hypothetical protein
MSDMIEPTDQHCVICATQMGVIHGFFSDTFYCRNYRCVSLPYSVPNEKGREILDTKAPPRSGQRLMKAVRHHRGVRNARSTEPKR